MTTIYLAGPILGCTDHEASGWRARAKSLLMDFDFLDPMARDYRGREDEAVAEIVEGDKEDIEACDAMIAMCPHPSVGTSMEILLAWQQGIPVFAVAPRFEPVSPWLRYHTVSVTYDLAEACLVLYRHTVKS